MPPLRQEEMTYLWGLSGVLAALAAFIFFFHQPTGPQYWSMPRDDFYYYLKIANAMFMGNPEEKEVLAVSWTMRAGLALAAVATLYIGIMPDRFIQMVNWALGIAQNPAVARLIR